MQTQNYKHRRDDISNKNSTENRKKNRIAILQFKANEAEQIVINLSKTKLIEA